eukprot:Cvel_2545.t2-p1 / transcript=Cvel_2545.t2 / gene=Cvel_2545 / organism=Chromera_velia_CCMP2878 / gene_product=hypothetical protein / transcript_product=hypothetical protein / location=Cvel_scaffold100:98535-100061(+) / protein_length=249 / sequence_SO=supercontig / SO=protein_coding / is_pseudo=false
MSLFPRNRTAREALFSEIRMAKEKGDSLYQKRNQARVRARKKEGNGKDWFLSLFLRRSTLETLLPFFDVKDLLRLMTAVPEIRVFRPREEDTKGAKGKGRGVRQGEAGEAEEEEEEADNRKDSLVVGAAALHSLRSLLLTQCAISVFNGGLQGELDDEEQLLMLIRALVRCGDLETSRLLVSAFYFGFLGAAADEGAAAELAQLTGLVEPPPSSATGSTDSEGGEATQSFVVDLFDANGCSKTVGLPKL